MYISELLNLFANAIYLKNKKIRNNFFENNVKTNTSEFQQTCKILKDFRNCIAHYNVKKYINNKRKFIRSLCFFEQMLKINVLINSELIDKIETSKKLSIKEILTITFSIDSVNLNDDKLLIKLFDEIALINGYNFKELPQRKTIIDIICQLKWNFSDTKRNGFQNLKIRGK